MTDFRKGFAILVGVKEVNPDAYNGWDGKEGCWGSEKDVDNMKSLLTAKGFAIQTLKTKSATAEKVLSALIKASRLLNPGDTLVFYYSGHGGQVRDKNHDEPDGKDETLICYNRELIDDELTLIWQKFKSNVRILMLSDSCHSGSNSRDKINQRKTYKPIRAFARKLDTSRINPIFIHIGACKDSQTAEGYKSGGVFTSILCNICKKRGFAGNYKALYDAILKQTKEYSQHAEYHEYGSVNSVEFKNFRNQPAFTIDLPEDAMA